jgi:succinoglycan biosynthesis protein ExoO
MVQSGPIPSADPDAHSVAVIIAAYNVVDYIERAIASVQAQTAQVSEIVVSDDGSTDGTPGLVRRLAERDARIKLVQAGKNTGPGAARNRAIEAATAEWVAVLDADDAWKPERVQRLLQAAIESSSVIVADNYLKFDDAAGRVVGAALPESSSLRPLTTASFIASEHPLGSVRFGMLKPMIQRRFLRDRDIQYATNIRLAEDFHLFLRVLLEGGKGVLLNEALYIYTLPQSLISGSQSRGSRTKPNLTDRVWIADDLIERYAGRVPPETLDLLRRYRGWMADIADGRRALEAWRMGDRWGALGMALARPRSTFSYAWTSPTLKRLRAGIEFKHARPPS